MNKIQKKIAEDNYNKLEPGMTVCWSAAFIRTCGYSGDIGAERGTVIAKDESRKPHIHVRWGDREQLVHCNNVCPPGSLMANDASIFDPPRPPL